jgi:DNA repair exonuclease SbcCD ATPase subunit
MATTQTPQPTPIDQVKELEREADALAKRQAAAAADAKTLQKANDDVEKEIATYIAEHDKLAKDTGDAKNDLVPIIDRIKQHAPDVAKKVDDIIQTYDADLEEKKKSLETREKEASDALAAMKTAEAAATEKQVDFDRKKGRREWLKTQATNLKKAADAADKKNDADAYGEAYAIAKIALDAAQDPPTVATYKSEIKSSLEALITARKDLRERTDDSVRKARLRDDLATTIVDLTAKRADNIVKLIVDSMSAQTETARPQAA